MTTSASSAAQASTLSSYEEAITQLLILGEKKSWLRESAWWTITLAIDALEGSSVDWKGGAIDVTLQHLFIENKIWSPEKVALALKLQDLYPDQDWKNFFAPSFKKPRPPQRQQSPEPCAHPEGCYDHIFCASRLMNSPF